MRNLVQKKSFFRIITGPKDCDRILEQFFELHVGEMSGIKSGLLVPI